ncbi:MAG: tetratricopeptide repeat protein [Alphaproteobacteria bacterium]
MPPRPALRRFAAVLLALAVALPAAAQQRAPGTPAAPPAAKTQPPSKRYSEMPADEAYRQCIGFAQQDPENGFEAAIAWRDEGGGPQARHCVAVALVGLGHFAEAAERLETLAIDMAAYPPQARAQVVGLATRAWLGAGRLTRAFATATEALHLDPDNVDLLLDRGEVLANAERYWDALDDFNRAVALAPKRVDALVLQAAAHRLVEAYDLARDDIARALAVAPDHPEALVELGKIRRADGDRVGAREAWKRVLTIAPDSPAGEAARRGIEQLELAGN